MKVKRNLKEEELKVLYNELVNGEKQIKEELSNHRGISKGFKKYCLFDKNWVDNFKIFYLEKNFNKLQNLLNIDSMFAKRKKYSYVNKKYALNFPYNYILVTEQFINLLSKYFNENEKKN